MVFAWVIVSCGKLPSGESQIKRPNSSPRLRFLWNFCAHAKVLLKHEGRLCFSSNSLSVDPKHANETIDVDVRIHPKVNKNYKNEA